VTALFEPQSTLVDSITYDITAWGVPYIYGVEAYALTEKVTIQETFSLPTEDLTISDKNPYAYIGRYQSLEDVKWLAYLLRKNVQVRSSERAFSIEGQSYPVGTLVVMRWDNEHVEGFDDLMGQAAEKFQKQTDTSSSGLVDSGQDFGSSFYSLLKAPKVALIGGSQSRSLDFGQAWYFFEQEVKYPLSVIDTDLFPRLSLDDYDVLVVPSGRYRVFNENKRIEIADWIRSGGRLVLIEDAIQYFSDTDQFSIKAVEEDAEESTNVKFSEVERDRISSGIPGAIYRVKMDTSHPLAFGYGASYPSLKVDESRYALLEEDWNVGVIESSGDLLSGFVGSRLKPKLANTLVFGMEQMGSGSVVYLVDNPLYRAFWYNGKMIFGNAVFLQR
jgi:hypothetical protein